MASDEPLQSSRSSTCIFAPRMLRLVISAGSSDAVWLCKVAERQMLRPSFVPPRPLRQLRDLTRYRIDLVGARTAEKQRVEKLLEDALHQAVGGRQRHPIFGVSGRETMAALIAGERDPAVLADMARSRMRGKVPQCREAFTGHFDDHHRFLLAKMLARVDGIDTDIAALDAQIYDRFWSFSRSPGRSTRRASQTLQVGER
jgi:transposase